MHAFSQSFSNSVMENTISIQAVDMGFSVEDISFAWHMKMSDQEIFTSIQQLIDSILTDSDSSMTPQPGTSAQSFTSDRHAQKKMVHRNRHRQLREKYATLKKRYECKVCFESEVQLVNLPCGHVC